MAEALVGCAPIDLEMIQNRLNNNIDDLHKPNKAAQIKSSIFGNDELIRKHTKNEKMKKLMPPQLYRAVTTNDIELDGEMFQSTEDFDGAETFSGCALDFKVIQNRLNNNIDDRHKPNKAAQIKSSIVENDELIRKHTKNENMKKLMPPELYKAVTTNNVIDFDSQLSKNLSRDLEISVFEQLSPRGDTLLHIAASLGYHQHVQKILKDYPKLVMIKNSAGNLPLHVAASSGHLSTLQILLDSGEKVNVSGSAGTSSNSNVQLTETNNDQETALHLALKNRHQRIARMLFDKDPNVTHYVNGEEKSPLYMAAEAGYVELFKDMMEHQDESDHLVNPYDHMAQKVVHVCIDGKNGGILDILLQKKWDSAFTSVDENGRNSLSYAALVGYSEGVKRILITFRESSYVADENGFFPIHMASSKGYIDIIEEFLQQCPDSRELNNNENQNILHLAAKNGRAKAVTYMLKNPQLQMLINERDCEGNTPLHLATKGSHPKVVSILTWDPRVYLHLMNDEGKTALDVAESFSGTVPSFRERLTWQALRHADAPRAPSKSIGIPSNPQNLKPEENNGKPEENNGKQEQTRTPGTEIYKDRLNTLLLVATLIVTVTFAAGFSVPGDDDDKSHGMRNSRSVYKIAFYIYIISNNIAFYSSSTAVVALIWSYLGDINLAITSLKFVLPLLGVALTMLSTAFISGVYLIVSKTIWLAILVVVLGVIATFAILLIFAPLVFPSSSLRPITRSIIYYPFHWLIIVTGSDVDHDKDEI